MYTEYFGLKEKPFNLTPSSRFIYLGESHKEALALLTYGVNERKGFILLTGEVGTGKTTMVQALLENIDDSIEYVYLSNPLLSTEDLMNYLAFSALRRKVHFKSKSEFLLEFENYLKKCLQHQKNFVMIVDEAQKLSFELLEEIRLLSNMETADEKLINIFLVGQPELNENLSQPQCRPLLQRISVRHHISPLNMDETGEYVMTRMKIAGMREGEKIFSKKSVKALHQYSSGYPRMINILADNALLLCYARQKPKVSGEIIRECYEDMRLDGSFLSSIKEKNKIDLVKDTKKQNRRYPWQLVAILIFLLIILGIGITPNGHEMLLNFGKVFYVNTSKKQMASKKEIIEPKKVNGKINENSFEKKNAVALGKIIHNELNEKEETSLKHGEENNIDPPNHIGKEGNESSQTIIVQRGDTVLELASRVYGYVDEKVLALLKEYNPELTDINKIEIGQQIVFPSLLLNDSKNKVFTVHIASFIPFEHARNLFDRLMTEGFEVYIMPVYHKDKGKIFRVTLGSFRSEKEGKAYAAAILRRRISDYAETIELEMK